MIHSGTRSGKPYRRHGRRAVFAVLALCLLLAVFPAQAQQKKMFETKAVAEGAVNLRSGGTRIALWGVGEFEGASARQRMMARSALDNLIGNNAIECEVMSRTAERILGQCVADGDTDLGLYMIQRGYAVADRASVYGTPFEEPYISAERQAQQSGTGIWAAEGGSSAAPGGGNADTLLLAALGMLGVLGAAVLVLIAVTVSGFKRLIAAQERNAEYLDKERQLKAKERKIVATMLDAEMRGNKSKIEAYLVVYDEMLKNLREQGMGTVKSSDMVQMQPGLDRSVFDKNADKLEMLGERLSSQLIHFYARIKTNPDYKNIEPDMKAEQAREIVERAVANAKKMDEVLSKMIENFKRAGFSSAE